MVAGFEAPFDKVLANLISPIGRELALHIRAHCAGGDFGSKLWGTGDIAGGQTGTGKRGQSI